MLFPEYVCMLDIVRFKHSLLLVTGHRALLVPLCGFNLGYLVSFSQH